MSTPHSERASAPRLLSLRGLFALGTLAALAFAALYPLASQRAQLASTEVPTALSLTYLRLALAERPEDSKLKLQLADAARALGHLNEARRVLAGLVVHEGPAARAARERMVELERAAWAAVPVSSARTRAGALARYRDAIRAVRPSELSAKELEGLAARAREAGDGVLRADLLGLAARRPGPVDRARVTAAERAYLETNRPLEAAQLRADSAERADSLNDALIALRHARSAARPEAAWALFLRLRKRFSGPTPLLEAGLGLASERDDQQAALGLAEELLAREPERPSRHVAVLQLASWSGQPKRALAEQMWLLEHGAGAEVRREAEANARALSELRALRRLYEQRPGAPERMPRTTLIQRIAVYEALGEPEAARALLMRALGGQRHQSDASLWALRLGLERAAGELDRAVETLAAMDAALPRDLARSELRADLLLRVGRIDDALTVLRDATPSGDYARLTRLARLAWTSSDVKLARAVYRDLTRLARATDEDFFHLYTLDVLEGDLPGALATTLRGYRRARSLPMLELAMNAALTAEDASQLSTLFEETEREGHPFQRDPRYVALRVSYRQSLAAASLAHGDNETTALLLAAAALDLERADPARRPETRSRLHALIAAQRMQELQLALAEDDTARLARLYPQLAPKLPVRQRVHVLHRLGRDDQALEAALAALGDPKLAPEEREALRRDADALAWNRQRQVSAQVELTDMGTLRLVQGRLFATYAQARREWSGGIEYASLKPTRDAPFDLSETNELIPWVQLRKLWGEQEASARVGLDLRDGASARPFVQLATTLRFDGAQVAFAGQLNDIPTDTAALRALGVRDLLSASLEVPFSARIYGSIVASGTVYSTRDRDLLGGGATAEGALGYRFFPEGDALHGNVRLAARVAPRWSVDALPSGLHSTRTDLDWLVPESTSWVGLGASLGQGQLTTSPIWGRRLSFLVDGAMGWLFPQDSLGFFAQAGLGSSLAGRDLLALTGRASNVVGTAPSRLMWGAQLTYTLGLWR